MRRANLLSVMILMHRYQTILSEDLRDDENPFRHADFFMAYQW